MKRAARSLLDHAVSLVRFRRHLCGPVRDMKKELSRTWHRIKGFRRWHRSEISWFYPLIYALNELISAFDLYYFKVPPVAPPLLPLPPLAPLPPSPPSPSLS